MAFANERQIVAPIDVFECRAPQSTVRQIVIRAVAHNLTRLKLSISHRILWMRRVAGEEQGFALLIVIIAVITLSLMMGAVMIAMRIIQGNGISFDRRATERRP